MFIVRRAVSEDTADVRVSELGDSNQTRPTTETRRFVLCKGRETRDALSNRGRERSSVAKRISERDRDGDGDGDGDGDSGGQRWAKRRRGKASIQARQAI